MGGVHEIVFEPFDSVEAYTRSLLSKARSAGAKVPISALENPRSFCQTLLALMAQEAAEAKGDEWPDVVSFPGQGYEAEG